MLPGYRAEKRAGALTERTYSRDVAAFRLFRLYGCVKLEMLWNISLGPTLRFIYIERNLLSRSTIGYERIHFWLGLTRADVIQLESVPREAVQHLFWCPYFESGWSSRANEWKQSGVSRDRVQNNNNKKIKPAAANEPALIRCTFYRDSASLHKLTWPTFYIFSAKRKIWVTAGNMNIFHLILS